MTYHPSLATRWQEFTLAEQMAHIGSEIDRSAHWYGKDAVATDLAVTRALELLDFTLADSRWKTRYKEIARSREVICDFFYGNNTYHSSITNLQQYFLQFGLLAARDR